LKRILLCSILLAAFIIAARLFLLHSRDLSPLVFKSIVSLRSCIGMKNKVVSGSDGWLFYEPELTYIIKPLPRDNIERIAGFDRTLREHGMELFVVPVPNKIDIYPEKFSAFHASHPVNTARLRLLRDLEHAGVAVIDLVPAFEAAKAGNVPVFDPFESHWTALGMEIAGRVIAERIDPLLNRLHIERSVSYAVNDTVLRGKGDLIGRIGASERLTWYSLPVHRVLCPDGSPYTDDRKSKIMILGDSYVNHGKWWNAHLGAQIARYLGRPTRTYFSLLANTEGPCMYSLKPKMFPDRGVVIWVFSSRVLQYHLGTPKENKG
jgi:hypothetical protein